MDSTVPRSEESSGAAIYTDTGPFAIVPEWVLFSGISARAIQLYAILDRHADQGRECFPGRERQAELLGCGLDAADRARKELVKVEAISVKRRGLGMSNAYVIYRSMPESRSRAEPRSGSSPEPRGTRGRPKTLPGLGTTATPPSLTRDVEVVEEQPITTQTIVGAWVDEYRRRGGDQLPSRVTGHLARETKKLLDEGIEPERVAAGMVRLLDRDVIQPQLLPHFVAEAQIRKRPETSSMARGYSAEQYMEDVMRRGN